MINIDFSLWLPIKRRKQTDYVEKVYSLTKNKSLEVQVSSWMDIWPIIGFGFRWSRKTDHAGFLIEFELLGLSAMVHFYDNRHWNDSTNSWEEYSK